MFVYKQQTNGHIQRWRDLCVCFYLLTCSSFSSSVSGLLAPVSLSMQVFSAFAIPEAKINIHEEEKQKETQ